MSNFDKAIKIIMAQPPEPRYPSYYADLLREADVPDMNIGNCSETPNSSETIYRQAAIDALRTCYDTETISMDNGDEYINYGDAVGGIEQLPSKQQELGKNDMQEQSDSTKFGVKAGKTCMDCISRQAAIDEVKNHYRVDNDLLEVIAYRISKLPPARAEVIRCKDCKHWTNNIGDSELRNNYCNEAVHGFYYRCSGDDYCSFAERKTDGSAD